MKAAVLLKVLHATEVDEVILSGVRFARKRLVVVLHGLRHVQADVEPRNKELLVSWRNAQGRSGSMRLFGCKFELPKRGPNARRAITREDWWLET